MSGVGSSPALATCETSQVLLAGVSGGFLGGNFSHSMFSLPVIILYASIKSPLSRLGGPVAEWVRSL